MTARVLVGIAITAMAAIVAVVAVYTAGSRPTPRSDPTIAASASTPTVTPTATATATPTASVTVTPTVPGWTDEQFELYTVVPSGFADGCTPLKVTDSGLRPTVVAAIRCKPGARGTPDYLEYYRFPSTRATEAAYRRYTGKAVSTGCDGNATKQGEVTCFERGRTRLIVWDDLDARIVYRAGSQKMSASEQWAWWQKGSSW